MNNVDFGKVEPASQMKGDSEHDTELLKQMLKEAQAYLSAFDWCEAIRESHFGLGVGGVVAVFLFRIIPSREGVDEWLWVVVGDLPPAYLVTDENPTPVSALEAYAEEMKAWLGVPISWVVAALALRFAGPERRTPAKQACLSLGRAAAPKVASAARRPAWAP